MSLGGGSLWALRAPVTQSLISKYQEGRKKSRAILGVLIPFFSTSFVLFAPPLLPLQQQRPDDTQNRGSLPPNSSARLTSSAVGLLARHSISGRTSATSSLHPRITQAVFPEALPARSLKSCFLTSEKLDKDHVHRVNYTISVGQYWAVPLRSRCRFVPGPQAQPTDVSKKSDTCEQSQSLRLPPSPSLGIFFSPSPRADSLSLSVFIPLTSICCSLFLQDSVSPSQPPPSPGYS